MGSTALLSEEFGPSFTQLDQPPCMWRDFQSYVATSPDALAVASLHQGPGLFGLPNLPLEDDDAFSANPYLRWSFRTLSEGIERLARAWRPLGVKERTPVVTFVRNSAEFVLITYVAIKLGCVIIPISPRNLTNEDEVRHMVKTGMKVSNGERPIIVAADEHLAFQVDELGMFPDNVKVILGSHPYSDWDTFQSHMDQTAQGFDGVLSPSAPENGGSVIFTSGTTSLPKGIFRVHTNWAAAYVGRGLLEGSTRAGDRAICNLPNNHAMGFITLTNCLSVGAGVIFPGSAFDPELTLEAMYREKITHTMMVPTMIHALVSAKATKYPDRPLMDLKNITFGGALLTRATLNLVTRELGARGGENIFGCTEGLLTSSGCTSDADFDRIIDGEEVSVGWPVAGYGVRIVDPETDEIVPRGALGEIHGCGPSVDGPYIGGVGADNWYEADGKLWYKTGDAGQMDNLGRIFITGRFKDM